MQVSKQAIDIIKDFEGFRDKAYLDTGEVPTIGYGTSHIGNKPVSLGMVCTKEEAEQWLLDELNTIFPIMEKLIKVEVNQNQIDAMASFVYNVGITAFTNSTLLKKLNMGDYDGATSEFSRWIRDNGKIIQGLVNRRKRERDLFSKEL